MMDDPRLPSGWRRNVVQRQSGKTKGQFDVYILSPDQKKFRSRMQISKYLDDIKSDLDISLFNFSIDGQASKPLAKKKPAAAKPESPVGDRASRRKSNPKKSTPSKQRLLVKLNFKKDEEEEKAESEDDEGGEANGEEPKKKGKAKVGGTANSKKSKGKSSPKRKSKKGKAAKRS